MKGLVIYEFILLEFELIESINFDKIIINREIRGGY